MGGKSGSGFKSPLGGEISETLTGRGIHWEHLQSG